MSVVKEGYLRHYINGSWEDLLVKLHSSGKLELVTLLPKTVACKSFHLGPLSIATTAESSTSLMLWGGVDQVFAIKIIPGSKNKPELFAVEKSKERRRWIEMINFITLRNALQLKHPHPLTAVIFDRRTYLQKILKSSVLPFEHGTIVCANCQTPAEQEAFLCEFCGDYTLCSACHRGFEMLESPFEETPHHPFPLVDPVKARYRFKDHGTVPYICNICSKDCTENPLRCVECDDYAECRTCAASHTKPVTNDTSLDIHLQPKLLAPVLLVYKTTFALNKERLHKCPRAASLISNRPWDLSTIDIIPASFAYFEVTFTKLNDKEGKVSVGVGNQIFVQNQLLGYQQNSFGYCCDGLVSQNTKRNVQKFPKYSEGDTVGAGILLDSYNQRKIYFTLNGQLCGTYAQRIHKGMDCFPGVSFTKNSEVEFVVKMTGPFKFDVSTIPDYRRDQTAYFSMLPPEVALQCLFLASQSHRQTVELRLVNKQFSKLALENLIWKSLYLLYFPFQNQKLKVKSWHTMFKRRFQSSSYNNVQGRWSSSSEGGIENCAMEFECPLFWDNLKASPDSHLQRNCDKCHKTVYKVDNFQDLKEYVQMGRCVSLELPQMSSHFMGAYAEPPPPLTVIPPPFLTEEGFILPDDDDDF